MALAVMLCSGAIVYVNANSAARGAAVVQGGPIGIVNAADFSPQVAPDALAAAFLNQPAIRTAAAVALPLPTVLAGTSLEVNGRLAGLVFVSATQINFLLPETTAPGTAQLVVRVNGMLVASGSAAVQAVAPAIFTANSNGQGVPAATLLRVHADNAQSFEPVAQFDALLNRFVPRLLGLGAPGERVFLILFLTGVRRSADPNGDGNVNETVRLRIGGTELTPSYVGRQGDLAGLDQLNAELPRSLLGHGPVEAIVTATNAPASKSVQLEIGGVGPPLQFNDLTLIADEDTPKSLTLPSAGTGVSRYVITRLPRRGRLEGTPPALTYKPAANENGADDFAFTVNNGMVESNQVKVDLLIRPINDPPVLSVPGPQMVKVGSPLSFTVSASEVDADQRLTFSAAGLPAGATFTPASATGFSFNWTPAVTQAGSYNLSFKVTDDGVPALNDSRNVLVQVDALFGQTSAPEGGRILGLFAGAPDLFAATSRDVFRSTDGGRSWEGVRGIDLSSGITNFSSARIGAKLFLATSNSDYSSGEPKLYQSNNGGQSWSGGSASLPGAPLSEIFYALAASESVLLLGTSHGLFRRDENNPNAGFSEVRLGLARPSVYSLGASGRTILAAAEDSNGSGLYLSTDQGQSWRAAAGLPIRRSFSLAAVGATLYIGFPDAVFCSTNNGQSWTEIGEGLPANLQISALAASGSDLFAGTESHGVFFFNQASQRWVAMNNGLTNKEVFCLLLSGGSVLAGTDEGVFVSTDQGQHWSQATAGLIVRVITSLAVSGKSLFAGTFSEGVYRSDNNGQSWVHTNNGLPQETYIYALLSRGTTLLAGTSGKGIFRSTNQGQSWAPVSGLPAISSAYSFSASGRNLVAGGFNSIFVSLDDGQSWATAYANSGSGSAVNSIVASKGKLVASGLGFLLVSSDDGQSWRNLSFQPSGLCFRQLAVSGDSLVAIVRCGDTGGAVYLSRDEGRNWAPAGAGLPNATIQALAVSGSNIFVGTASGLFTSTDQGQSWVATGLANQNVSLLAAGEGSLFAVTATGIFQSSNSGLSWNRSSSGLPMADREINSINALLFSGANLFAATRGGGVFRSVDEGASWSAANGTLPNASLPPSANVFALAESMANLFAGTLGEGVYRSTDAGQRWTAVNQGLANKNVNALLAHGATLLAGTDNGIFRSFDNGQSWALVEGATRGTRVMSLISSGGRLFAGTDRGGVFVSLDNGGSWEALNNGLATLDIRILAHNGTTLFAGAFNGGVFSLPDGGRSWRAVNKDLPQRLPVFSLAVNGSRLFAGTIHGIFLSADSGENWQQINVGLFDVYVTSLTVRRNRLLAGTRFGGVFVSEVPD